MALRERSVAHVAITCADDTVAIMQILTDDARGIATTTDAASVNMLVARAAASFDKEKLPVKGWIPIDPRDIPADRTFRNALRHDGMKFTHDLAHARKLGIEKVRAYRYAKLVKLDAEWMKYTGQGQKARADAIENERQALRDLPQLLEVSLDRCLSCDDIKKALPPEALE